MLAGKFTQIIRFWAAPVTLSELCEVWRDSHRTFDALRLGYAPTLARSAMEMGWSAGARRGSPVRILLVSLISTLLCKTLLGREPDSSDTPFALYSTLLDLGDSRSSTFDFAGYSGNFASISPQFQVF